MFIKYNSIWLKKNFVELMHVTFTWINMKIEKKDLNGIIRLSIFLRISFR